MRLRSAETRAEGSNRTDHRCLELPKDEADLTLRLAVGVVWQGSLHGLPIEVRRSPVLEAHAEVLLFANQGSYFHIQEITTVRPAGQLDGFQKMTVEARILSPGPSLPLREQQLVSAV